MSRPPNEKRRPGKGGVGPQLAGDRSKTQYPILVCYANAVTG